MQNVQTETDGQTDRQFPGVVYIKDLSFAPVDKSDHYFFSWYQLILRLFGALPLCRSLVLEDDISSCFLYFVGLSGSAVTALDDTRGPF